MNSKTERRLTDINKYEKAFRDKLVEQRGQDYIMLGEYQGSNKKTLFRHKCGYEWEATPSNVLKLKSCPKCSGNARITTKDFKEEVRRLVGEEYSVKGEYTNARNPIEMVHHKCGHEFATSPYSFTAPKGTRCPKCARNIRWTTEKFRGEVYKQVGEEYTFLDEYTNNSTKMRCVHQVCGYEWRISSVNFLDKGARCPKCAGNARVTHKEFTDRVQKIHGKNYKFLEEYVSTHTPIKYLHSCGYEGKISPANILRGRECPQCKIETKGERFVRGLLEDLNIDHQTQKTFKGCRYKGLLRFDFYIPRLNLAIEYDGEQHFFPVDFYGEGKEIAKKNFELTQIRDEIKDKFCDDNGINLLRVPYYIKEDDMIKLINQTIQTSRSNAEELMPKI